MLSFFGTIILFIVALSAIGLIVAYVLVPLFRGVGWLIGAAFKSVGWLFAHVFEYIGGTVGDLIRLVGSLLTCIVLLPFAPLNVVLGRWSAAGHYAETLKREAKVACSCVYRILLRRPLKLFWLHGILEGLEQRVPEAMAAAPASDKPSRRTGTFDGYEIVGSLPGGGSGAKLYIARPSDDRRRRLAGPNERVVIKSFALSEGSALPQIVRESRALEAARQLGLVLDHGMDDLRFFYVMPYHAGDHLGIVTRQLHAESDGRGLHERGQRLVMGYMGDLLGTLNRYHAGGLWHKDVKPENIIIHDGQAHLVDLGLVTPLRSAMTLTTHGTEYFRDPELVRQALRGVKVHQIDGAKFDVYAVGAVTYYMIENTFPAHGGLSRFTKKSPEALRWVIKRAMADYNQRYETSDAMLADLRAVLAAPDPFVVRPVDLPSMRGGSQPETPAAVAIETPRAATPGPDTLAGAAAAAVAAADDVADVSAAVAEAAAGPDALSESAAVASPGLRVTNWWTGAYEVNAGPVQDGSTREQQQAFRSHVRDMRAQAGDVRSQANMSARSARRAAKDQIRAARERARDLRQRAHARRHAVANATHGRQPSGMLGGLVAFVVIAAVVGPFVVNRINSGPSSYGGQSIVMSDDGTRIVDTGRPSVLMVIDGDWSVVDEAEASIERVIKKYEREYDVVTEIDEELNASLASLLNEWDHDQDGPADSEIERFLDDRQLYGLVRVELEERRNRRPRVSDDRIIFSEASDADERRYPTLIGTDADWAPPGAAPLLLVNDHPAKNDDRVVQRVGLITEDFRTRKWTIVLDDEVEAMLRKVLPTGPIWEIDADDLSPRFHATLADKGFGGVLLIGAAPGEGEIYEVTFEHLAVKNAD